MMIINGNFLYTMHKIDKYFAFTTRLKSHDLSDLNYIFNSTPLQHFFFLFYREISLQLIYRD